jgi:hypothetical protein
MQTLAKKRAAITSERLRDRNRRLCAMVRRVPRESEPMQFWLAVDLDDVRSAVKAEKSAVGSAR